ncbi:neuropilin-1-like [Ostrea edulis]|uniref:neuropilin-1-like n=1 Tax=Ostrea edulis TaxID=37623 RepID=UPI002095FDFC|nr:neuropilin-1-like [Ostrea edulis]
MVHYCNEILFLLILSEFIQDYAFLTTLIAEVNPRQFTSHSTYNTENYPNNYTGEWLLKSTEENNTILVTLMECDIEAVINKGQTICRWEWDLLSFYNVMNSGNTTQYQYIESTCCNGTLGSISSTGPELFIKFTTDGSTSKKGFKISYLYVEPSSNCTRNGLQAARSSVQESESNTSVIAGAVVGVTAVVIGVVVFLLIVRSVLKKKVNSKD